MAKNGFSNSYPTVAKYSERKDIADLTEEQFDDAIESEFRDLPFDYRDKVEEILSAYDELTDGSNTKEMVAMKERLTKEALEKYAKDYPKDQ